MSKSKKSAPRKVAKSTAPAAKTEAGIPLKRIAADLGIEPKAARRKLRAANLSFHSKRERWVFGAAQAKQAREVLAAGE